MIDLSTPAVGGATAAPRVSDAAFARLAEILATEPPGAALRVAVDGGGCSGFQYRFELDRVRADDDLVFEKNGAAVLVDAVSAPLLANAVIDYKRELIGARFVVENPNATSSCGCGVSFSM